jgi:hypothetical protein
MKGKIIMLYIFGLYIFFGIIQVLVLLSILRARNIIITKEDKFQLFTLCCVLAIAYPYMAIYATYAKFSKDKTQVLNAEVVK